MSLIQVGESCLLVSGRLIKIAEIFDEVWLEPHAYADPEVVMGNLKNCKAKVDIFTFSQRLPETIPKYD